MLFRAECEWCGEHVRALVPARRRVFRSLHDESCGASGNLSWLSDVREAREGVDHGSELVAASTVDLRDHAPLSRSA